MFNSCIKHLITIVPAIQSDPDPEKIQLRVENEQLKAQVNKLRWGVSKIKGAMAKNVFEEKNYFDYVYMRMNLLMYRKYDLFACII